MVELRSSISVVIRRLTRAAGGIGRLAGEWIRRFRRWLLCNGVEAPFDIGATITGGAAVLTWMGDSTNVGAYVVERSDNDGPYQIRAWAGAGAVPGIHAFAWADVSIDLAGRYCYRLTAQHTDGRRGCPADPLCIQGCNGLPTPFEVVAIAWGANENRLLWKCDATNLSQFGVERSVGGLFSFQQLAVVPAGTQPGVQQYSYSDFTIQGGELYCYRIASQNSGGTLGCPTAPACAGSVYY